MSFIRKDRIKGKEYYYLVESHRQGNKVIQKRIKYLGKNPFIVGTIRHGRDIGIKPDKTKFIWAACEICGKQRWVQYVAGKPVNSKCHNCALQVRLRSSYNRGSNNSHWKGGRRLDHGYTQIKLYPDSPFFLMACKSGYVYEHRLVMAQYLGRCLDLSEVVHHLNHDRQDNRRENLELISVGGHQALTNFEESIERLIRS